MEGKGNILSMNHLVIIGAGEFGRELYWHAQESFGFSDEFDIKGFIDDDYNPNSDRYVNLKKPLISSIDDYEVEPEDVFICAVGSVNGREATVKKIKAKGGRFINLINRTSLIQGNVSLGEGVFIGPYTVIGDSVSIHDHVMLNTHSSIGHDAVLDDYTCVMSYVDITGCCQIGKKVFIASGARMTPSTKIGDEAYVGIGSVVLRRVKAGTKVFGNPARIVEI